jgi:hypothetical protein
VPVLTSFGGGTESSKLNSGAAAGATLGAVAVVVDRGRTVVSIVAGAPVVAVWPLHALATTMTIPATSTLVLRLPTVDTLGNAMRKITMGKFARKANENVFCPYFFRVTLAQRPH